MGLLVLLVVAAIWVAVLVPPLVRSRLENRPNSSVSDFRDQLSSLQRAMPAGRTVSMRGMARPLAPAPLARPAATGRPLRSGVTLAGGGNVRSAGQQAAMRPAGVEHARPSAGPARRRTHGDATGRVARRPAPAVSGRDALKRRRANVLFVLGVTAACSVFLAVTSKSAGMTYVAVAACLAAVSYVVVLASSAQPTAARPRRPAAERAHRRSESGPVRAKTHGAPTRRPREQVDQFDQYEPAPRVAAAHDHRDHRVQSVTRARDTTRRRELRDDTSYDPRPSGLVYGEPALFAQPHERAARRASPGHRTVEWSPAS
jgi:hypothetical protein